MGSKVKANRGDGTGGGSTACETTGVYLYESSVDGPGKTKAVCSTERSESMTPVRVRVFQGPMQILSYPTIGVCAIVA